MQKLLLSLAVIVAVGGAAAASTGAFFSDTETSTGNTFAAGAIDLTVDNTQHYNGNVCDNVTPQSAATYQWVGNSAYPVPGTPCDGTWLPTNLGASTHFFNFGDVKPGDNGEDTVSLHIDNNPAWACLNIKTTANDDNTCNGPESAAGSGDPECIAAPNSNPGANNLGELAQNIAIVGWLDNGAGTSGAIAGDNIWQVGEPQLFATTTLSGLTGPGIDLPLADSLTGNGPLSPTATNYIGLAWCAGTFTSAVPGNVSCSGALMNNAAQTDSAKADVTFTVVQSRNNSQYLCPGHN